MKKITLLTLSGLLWLCSCGGTGDPVPDDASEYRSLLIRDSIGVEMGDSNYVLGAIEGVAHGINGEIMILDRSAACIKVYDGEGDWIGQIGRRGSAPGELENPISFAVLGDGRICVCDPWRGGLLTYLPDFSFEALKVEMYENTPALMQGTSDSGFVAGKVDYTIDGSTIIAGVRFLRYDLEPEPSHVYQENVFEVDYMDLGNTLEQSLFWGSFTADREGNVFFAEMEPDRYEIIGLRQDGTEYLRVERPTLEVPRTAEELEDEKAWVRAKLEGWDANWGVGDWDPQPLRNQVRSLDVDGENRLWALRGTSEEPTFDVFDSETGEFLFSARLEGTGYEGLFWNFSFSEHGILAWSESPRNYPVVYLLELSE